jgi:cation transport regulator ChaB
VEMKRTISGMIGKGSIAHNERKFIAENVDAARTIRNVVLQSENVKDIYHELFDEAIERYNAKQKRKDRKIKDYYEHIRTGKQEKVFHEAIFQIGNKDDTGCLSREGQIARLALLDFAKDFQKRNPQFRVFGIYLHMDEATPHLHIDFVPYVTGSKRGSDTRVSMKQALASRGFVGKGRENTEYNQWMESEKQELAKIAERYGMIWEQKGTHREHLDVLNFKKEQREQEVAALEEQKAQLQKETAACHELADNLHEELRQTGDELQKKKAERAQVAKEVEQAKATANKYEKSLKKAKTIAKDIQKYAGEFSKPVDEVLPEAGMLESAKNYRDKKAYPVISELKELLYGLYLKYIQVKEQLDQVVYKYDRLKDSNHTLAEQKQELLNENIILKEEQEDFRRLKRVIGEEQSDYLIQSERSKEIESKNRDKVKRRVYDQYAR